MRRQAKQKRACNLLPLAIFGQLVYFKKYLVVYEETFLKLKFIHTTRDLIIQIANSGYKGLAKHTLLCKLMVYSRVTTSCKAILSMKSRYGKNLPDRLD